MCQFVGGCRILVNLFYIKIRVLLTIFRDVLGKHPIFSEELSIPLAAIVYKSLRATLEKRHLKKKKIPNKINKLLFIFIYFFLVTTSLCSRKFSILIFKKKIPNIYIKIIYLTCVVWFIQYMGNDFSPSFYQILCHFFCSFIGLK